MMVFNFFVEILKKLQNAEIKELIELLQDQLKSDKII